MVFGPHLAVVFGAYSCLYTHSGFTSGRVQGTKQGAVMKPWLAQIRQILLVLWPPTVQDFKRKMKNIESEWRKYLQEVEYIHCMLESLNLAQTLPKSPLPCSSRWLLSTSREQLGSHYRGQRAHGSPLSLIGEAPIIRDNEKILYEWRGQ